MRAKGWSRRVWVGLVVWLGAGWVAPALAAPDAAEIYSKSPVIGDVVISPSGKRLAMLAFGATGMRQLGVMNLDPIGEPRAVGGFASADITKVRWVNDDKLVFEAFERGAVIQEGGGGTFSVNHDGSDLRQLIALQYVTGNARGTAISSRILPYGWFVHSTIDDGSDDVFVAKTVWDSVGEVQEIQLARLNTSTRELRVLSPDAPPGTRNWFLNANYEPRLVVAYRAGRHKVYWRATATAAWKEVADFDPLSEGAFEPWFIDADGKVLVEAVVRGDTQGLYKFDPATGRLDPEPLVHLANFDLNPERQIDLKTRRLVGLHFRADRPMSVWFDEGLQRVQRGIDSALPERNNRLYCGRCESARFLVVRSKSDRQPGEYFLFDREKSALQRIGAARPWINEAGQGRRSFHRVATRDGLQMPVYVTHPAGSKTDQALPTVVLVHGGPFVRGTDLEWHAEAQFLASRGYRVVEPEFRGSTGYGFRHFKAGWKQWGRAMQSDLEDAVQWAAKQGLTDPKRVCITGASYGGYAALMGPIASPGTYRCAASFAGVTDIDLMYSISWSDLSEDVRKYSMPLLIGDREKDAELLAKVSPLNRAAEIKVPLLVAHGAFDRRVPIKHAYAFVAAARKGEVEVEQIDYPDEGHGFFRASNQASHFRSLDRFFQKSLKAAE